MAELQRSVTSFRRQGSSGLVWDDKFVGDQNEEAKGNQNQQQNERVEVRGQRLNQSVGSIATLERSRSTGTKPYRTVTVAPPSKDPPSPKLPTCALCLFGAAKSKSKSKKLR
ncbi:hypothetical protein VNO77_24319 [Canavalia gladiata]|uniref:Uncharacterized protein n=1 Tax=Canavalia gladiata TaxID=3824 RepID=A0AAN9L9C9_CANGL